MMTWNGAAGKYSVILKKINKKQQFSQLVSTYEFDRIVYFSEYLIFHSKQEGELECLRRVLQANRECPVQLLYLAGPEEVAQPAIGKLVMAQAAEALCLFDFILSGEAEK